MSLVYESKGSMATTVMVSQEPDRSGNFVCNGTADDVTIQVAVAYVEALGGGKLLLLGGTYDITNVIDLESDMIVEGVGDATLLNVNASWAFACLAVTSESNIIIRNLKITKNAGTAQDISITDATNVTVSQVHFDGGFGIGIRTIGTCSDIWLVDNLIEDKSRDGILITTTTAETSGKIYILDNRINAMDRNGIFIGADDAGATLQDIIIGDNIITEWAVTTNGHAINLYAFGTVTLNDIKVRDNILLSAGSETGSSVGIYLHGDDNPTAVHDIKIDGNTVIGTTDLAWGIGTESNPHTELYERVTIADNLVYSCQGGISAADQLSGSVEDNFVEYADEWGISMAGSFTLFVTGNTCKNNGQVAAVAPYGIRVGAGGPYIIKNNACYDDQGPASQTYGIAEIGAADGNVITQNYFAGNATAPVLILGAATVLESKSFQFIQGTTFISADGSAKGWEINAEADMAVALGQLPLEVQQVVRLKIWAVALGAPVGAGGQMHLDVLFNAGASLEAYNLAANSWTLANFDGEEADYVATDVIHWVIEDGDVGNEIINLLGGDSLECKVNGGTAADPDGATNATFRVLELDYV